MSSFNSVVGLAVHGASQIEAILDKTVRENVHTLIFKKDLLQA